jgi:formiminotetrahydrofolate cyclodeaminase
MVLQLPVAKFIDDLASRNPTPGGGSASALGGALGVALGNMAAAYTSGDKYASVAVQIADLSGQLSALRQGFAELIQKDIDAYAGYAAARGMAKGTPEEKKVRTAAIDAALETATIVPEQIVDSALNGLKIVEELGAVANPNLAGDVAVAAYFLEAAARGAGIQVLSNSAAPDTTGKNAARRAAVIAKIAACQAARERIDGMVLKLLKL